MRSNYCRVWSRLGHGVTTPLRLEAITVCSSPAAVDAISFCYWDEQGKKSTTSARGVGTAATLT